MGTFHNESGESLKIIVSENEKMVCYAIAMARGVKLNIEKDAPLNRLQPKDVIECLESLRNDGIVQFSWHGTLLDASLLVDFNLIDVDKSARAIANRLFKPSESHSDLRKNLLPFLTPNSNATTDFLNLRQMVAESPDWVMAKLREIDYPSFLLTPYWGIVSERVKADCGHSCVLCGHKEELQAHHRNYYSRGIEILDHLKQLTCLCSSCHGNFHNNNHA